MKKFLAAALILCLAIPVGYAQNDSLELPVAKNQTLLEQTLNATGFLLKKEVIPVGTLRGYTFDVLKVSNLENFQQVTGIRISQDFPAGGVSKTATTFKTYLDSREVESLLTTLNYMKTVVKLPGYPANYTELYFNSLSGAQLVLYISQPSADIKRWGLAFQIDTNINKTFTNLYINDIDSLISLLEAAKAKF